MKTENLNLLTSPKGNYVYIFIGLIIAIPITLVLTLMFISLAISPFQPVPIDIPQILGLLIGGLIMMLLPLYIFSIAFRVRHIYYDHTGFHFSGKNVLWNEVEKISILKGNSAYFTIKYIEGNKTKKVFGSLFVFKRKEIIQTLRDIASKRNIALSTWWI